MNAQNKFGTAIASRGIGARGRKQQGASLIVSLILLLLVSMLGVSAAQIAIEEGKAARDDRDRQIALQAAEAALQDAELDIENSPDVTRSRSHIFSMHSALGFPQEGESGCQAGEGNIYLGLCSHASGNAKATWLGANFLDDAALGQDAVPYGKFTGKTMQVAKGNLPSKLPKYVIELLPYNQPGENAEQPSYFYRVTAMGFGAKRTTTVVLQSFYRKES